MVVPNELKELKQWVNANKGSKCPMIGDKPASVAKPETWLTFEEALKNVKNGINDFIGFVFNDNGIIGIDLDRGKDDIQVFDEDGFLTEKAIKVLQNTQSFSEISISGKGIHIYVKGDLPFNGSNNRKNVEIYKKGHFFIFTGDVLIFDKIVENQKGIDYVIQEHFKFEREKCSQSVRNQAIYEPIIEFKNGKLITKYPPIEQGMRNISLTSLAGQLHNAGASFETIYNKLQKVNEQSCKPPISENELESIVESVTRYQR